MDRYKKIIKNKETRLKILKVLSCIPDSVMVPIQYYIKFKRWPNLKNPKRFTEKIQWYKLNYKDPVMSRCTDKYKVRGYVEENGLQEILNKCYGVYDTFTEINFAEIPDKFVLKTTNGCGTNLFCKNRKEFDFKAAEAMVERWLVPQKSPGREWSYDNIKPRIIVEEYLKTPENQDLLDYKFFCFEGEPTFVQVDFDRFTNHSRNFYDMNFNLIDLQMTFPNKSFEILKPKNYERMIDICKKLSKNFPHVRVDLYNIEGEIRFGELTFYHGSGHEAFNPDEYDFIFGELFNLKNKTL